MVSQLIDMSRFYDLAGIQIAVHRLAIDSVKISAAWEVRNPLRIRQLAQSSFPFQNPLLIILTGST